MFQHLRPSLVMIALFTLVTGVLYPLAVTGVAGLALPRQAGGSLMRGADGQVRGSYLIAQGFSGPGYLHPRPSGAGTNGYDASASSGTNLGPMDPKLADRIKGDAAKLAAEAPSVEIPADAVTTSGSGLDPDISPENARFQAPRIAAARGMTAEAVRSLIGNYAQGATLGFIGQPRVNVLKVNEALDRDHPMSPPKG